MKKLTLREQIEELTNKLEQEKEKYNEVRSQLLQSIDENNKFRKQLKIGNTEPGIDLIEENKKLKQEIQDLREEVVRRGKMIATQEEIDPGMHIGELYKIESDALNVILKQKYIPEKGDQKGQIIWRPVGFYSNTKQALKGLVEREINGTGFKDFRTVVMKIEELKRFIESINF